MDIDIPDLWQDDTFVHGLPDNATYSGMGILGIIDGIFGTLPLGQLQVEIELAVGSPHEEEEPCRIPANLLQYIPQRCEIARTG